ncbi:MAG: CDP-glucose 4,6-dehydratase [Methylophilaceae bacterium]
MESLGMTASFWRGKRVFLTGHTGFKGSWLSLWLQSEGAIVTGYALNPTTSPSLFEVAKVAEGMHSIIADIRDIEKLKREVKKARPEIIFHMAAQALVRYSYENPVETYSTNVMGTVHLLEAVRESDTVRAVVNVTSDKCYENQEWVWGYRENEPMGGFDPYSNSKGCSELVTAAYRNSFFNPAKYEQHGVAIATGRAGNVIGGGDWAGDRLVPDIIRAIVANEQVVIRSPHATRPWQHVLEPLSGYLTIAERLHTDGLKYSGAWNFGPYVHDVKPVDWIVNALVRHWGDSASYMVDETKANLHEAHYLKLDCSKAHSLLQWQPHWNIAQTIEKISAWHKAQLAGENMQTYSKLEIQTYKASNQN